MKRIWSVAHNTFVEAIRDRILYSLLLFAVVMILSSLIFADISVEQYNKVVKDLGLTAISLIGIIISIFLGMGLVHKEIEKKTVYNIFSKPVRRYEFILGKYLGLVFTLFINTVAMAVVLFLLVLYIENIHAGVIEFYYGGHFYSQFFKALYFEFLEFIVVIAIVLVFSSFTTPVLSALFAFFLFTIGRFSSDILLLAEQVKSPAVNFISKLVYTVIPQLEKFDIRSAAVYGGEVSTRLVVDTTGYALLYALALLVLSVTIFSNRDFK